MTKKYDIRDLYVATIAKQGDVKGYIKKIKCYTSILKQMYYENVQCYDWDYSDEKLGIFIPEKSSCGRIIGYKHILTDTIYYLPIKYTGGQYVIKPNEIHELCKYDKELAKHFIMKNKSYRVKLDQIDYMEDRFNNDNKVEDEYNV